ncbi:MAG: SMP-30/gluconolactonase/LRE family protein [Candidatus Rokubacteria bacterium]|nr:SMP-30/gluconolactonase/LRE family protein [Candidatus Rokubacteria bacterium]
MYGAPPELTTRVFARVPGARLLEGPSFDRGGHLWVTDIPNGRIARIAPDGGVTIVAEYDGEPNGLKIHRDGRIFIADHKQGLLLLDPASGEVSTLLDRPYRERFKGLNDLLFARNGDLYFTDQGESDLRDPTGRLYRLGADGLLDCLLDGVPSPNGLVLTPDGAIVYLAVTRMNAIWRVPVAPVGVHGVGRLGLGRVGAWVYLSGGLGPDGLAMDTEGRVAAAHPGSGNVWVFNRRGEPVWRIRLCEGTFATNVAYGGPDMRRLYITEVDSGTVQVADLDVPGLPLFSHVE